MLMEMLNYCLTHNIFLFKGELFLQKQGTAMGTSFAPTYANLFMAVWEANVLKSRYKSNIKTWTRFIDYLFVVWEGDSSDLELFIQSLNNNNYNLSFTSIWRKHQVTFLHVEVFIKDHKICTRMYRKPTASNSILHANSGHPQHLKWSIPYGEMLRAKRNCLETYDIEQNLNEMSVRKEAIQ